MNRSLTWVMAFDVADNRRRAKLSHYLESKGSRVQRSVFEVVALQEQMLEIIEQATGEERFLAARDSLKVYALCAACRQLSQALGTSTMVCSPGVPLVL